MKTKIGIGARREFVDELIEQQDLHPDFVELAPENWMKMGGYWGKKLRQVTERYPVTCHGLSLSLGSPEKLDYAFVKDLKKFLEQHDVQIFSEHLSYTKTHNAHVYDLLPIPFREDAVKHVAQRIREAQELLGRRIAIENVSYYTEVDAEMDEATFIRSIVEEADCDLLLDVNNVYVNAFNHNYDAKEHIKNLPLHRVAYIHMAGHEQVEPDLIIDTHGEAIIDPVYELFHYTVNRMKEVPVLLERDFNFPELTELQQEMNNLRSITEKAWRNNYAVAK